AALVVQDAQGHALNRFDFRLTEPDAGTAILQAIAVGPRPAVIGDGRDQLQLDVAAVYSNGRILNVSGSGAPDQGTDPRNASIDAKGLVTAVAGGVTPVTVGYAGLTANTVVTVQHAALVTGIESRRTHYALTAAGANDQLRIDGQLSDGFIDDITTGANTTY